MTEGQLRGHAGAASLDNARETGFGGSTDDRSTPDGSEIADGVSPAAARSSWLSPSGLIAILALLYCAVVVVAYVLRPGGEEFMALISDFAEPPVELVAVLMCIAVVTADRRPKARIAWTLIALATAADGIGNLLYGLYDVAGQSPFPSVADGFYLAFYPLLLVGLLVLPTASRRHDLLDWRIASNVAIVIIGGSMAVLHFMLAPVIPELGKDPLASIILLAYPVGDLALLAALATVTTRRPFAGDQPTIVLIGGVIGLWLGADILYAVDNTGGGGFSSLTDLLYLGGAMGLLLGARSSLAQQRHPDRHAVAASPDATRAGPYLMLLLGLATLIAAAVAYAEIALLAVMAVGLTALVVARQVVDDRERRRADALLLEAHRTAATEARWKARHDPLTGLANRARLEELLRQELTASTTASRPVTVVFIDLNGFKAVNDTFGHAAGDELLVAVAHRLERSVRSSDSVVRLGGDEFAIVLPRIAGDQALEVVRRAAATLDQPFAIAGTSVVSSAAFGLATSAGVGTADFDALLSRADTAMYRAKRHMLGPTFFDPHVDQLSAAPTPNLQAQPAAG
ncbi:MAG: diguanylate cyclase domain-containing protein [Candidatus Limnocylindrales bacterium]